MLRGQACPTESDPRPARAPLRSAPASAKVRLCRATDTRAPARRVVWCVCEEGAALARAGLIGMV